MAFFRPIPVWLDCDPGHDDVTAILLALHTPNLRLVGVSTVHGNTGADNTRKNAARSLYAFGAPPDVQVWPGAAKPLIRPVRADPEIHGLDGLGGVEGLPAAEAAEVQARLDGPSEPPRRAIEGIAQAVIKLQQERLDQQLTIVSTGPMTNVALFVSAYPDLLVGISQIVFMGGGVGVGNRSAVAEYNILCDPEATQIVLNTPVKKVMVPLNVTHTAIMTRSLLARLHNPSVGLNDENELPQPITKLRHMMSTLIRFFADSYRATFGFLDGPPLHDALAIAYVASPEIFFEKRYRVDVELSGSHTAGETVVDIWNYRVDLDKSWGATGKNCVVTEKLGVDAFFELFFNAVAKCDQVSPLNI